MIKLNAKNRLPTAFQVSFSLAMSRNGSLDDGRESHDCVVVLFPSVALGDNFGLGSKSLDRAVLYAFKC